jgi:hypothetical protein
MSLKQRSMSFKVKALDEEGHFSGYGSVFDVVDFGGDRVLKGAFADTLKAWSAKGRLPGMFWHHKRDRPVGRWTSMREDDHGLFVDGKLAIKTIDGADAYEHFRAGTVEGLSIGYDIPEGGASWNRDTKSLDLKTLDLWEVSPVSMPMNDSARIESVKAALENPREMERLLRDAGLSRSEAKALMAEGFKALSTQRDAADADADDVEALRSLTKFFQELSNV